MIWAQLWTDYLSWTQPVLSGGILWVFFQMGLGTVTPSWTLFHIIKRKNKAEALLLCLVPFIFIISIAIVEPLFFGSFLGDGFTSVSALRNFLYQPAFFQNAVVLSGVFLVLAGLYFIVDGKNESVTLKKVLFNIGLETLFVLIVLGVEIDYFLTGGQLFLRLGDTAVKWFVYGCYLLLNKSGLYLVCCIWSVLFSEHYDMGRLQQPGAYEAWVRRYLTESYRVVGYTMFLFFVVFSYFAVYYPYKEEGNRGILGIMLLLDGIIAVVGIYTLLISFFPKLLPNYRRILRWGNPQRIARLMYEEIVQLSPQFKSDLGVITEHFFVYNLPVKRIFYRPLFEKSVETFQDVHRLYFRDGSSCNMNRIYQPMLELLCDARPNEEKE